MGKPQHPKVRELFPADDVIAQWVFALTATAQDLAVADRALTDALDGGVAFRSSYLYRQLIARVYEAERVLIAVDQHDDVGAFVADLAECEEPVTSRIRRCCPGAGRAGAVHRRADTATAGSPRPVRAVAGGRSRRYDVHAGQFAGGGD
jgi:hypothetical protein